MINSYANYFYLFDNTDFLRYPQHPLAGTNKPGQPGLPYLPTPFDWQTTLVGGPEIDSPTADTITERTSLYNISVEATYIVSLGKSEGWPTMRSKTRNPTANQQNVHIISLFKTHPVYRFQQEPKTLHLYYYQTLEGKAELKMYGYNALKKAKGPMILFYNGHPHGSSNSNDQYTPISSFGLQKDFKFTQGVKVAIRSVSAPLSSPTKPSLHNDTFLELLTDFYNTYVTSITGQAYINDISTVFGIPFDYDAVLYNTPEAKTLGVTTKQPIYHQIYNYYDMQYEPLAIDLITQNITDEKALPSIYDFIYMSVQEKMGIFLKLPKMSYEEINLAAINRYLDAYARVYSQYYQQQEETTLEEVFTVDIDAGIIEVNFQGAGGKPLPFNTLIDGPAGLPGDILESGLLKLQANPRTIALQTLEAIAQDPVQVEIIKNSNPVWLNELKTGIYFSDKSYDLFNQTLDKDFVFPFFVKIDLPTENVGPITKLFKQNNILDSLNSYVASKTIPGTGGNSVYSNFYGGVVSGLGFGSGGYNNVIYDLKLNNIKVILSPKPLEPEVAPATEEAEVAEGGIPIPGTDTVGGLDVGGQLDALTGGTPVEDEEGEDDLSGTPTTIWGPDADFSKTNWYKILDGVFVQTSPLLFAIAEKLKQNPHVQAAIKHLSYKKLLKEKGKKEEDLSEQQTKILKQLANKPNNSLLSKMITGDAMPGYRSTSWYYNAWRGPANANIIQGTVTEEIMLEAMTTAHESIDHAVEKTIMDYFNASGTQAQGYREYIQKYFKDQGIVHDPWNPDPVAESIIPTNLLYGVDLLPDVEVEVFEDVEEVLPPIDWGRLTDPRASVDIYLDDLAENVFEGVLIYQDEQDQSIANHSGLGKLLKKLRISNLKSKLSNLFQKEKTNLLRGPGEINNGKFAHQETIMYEIVKYRIEGDGGEKYIQSIFLPITQQEKLSYYDTQVIPYQNYLYKIFAHKMILGSRYRIKRADPSKPGKPQIADTQHLGKQKLYPNAEVEYNDQGYPMDPEYVYEIQVNYEIEPYLEIVRVPYYNTNAVNVANDVINYTRIEDSPPLPPQINFVPFRNVNNKVLIMMNNSMGEYEAYPRVIFPTGDQELFEQIYSSQDRKPDSKILFKSDDSQGTFQIFRLDTLPTDYTDFQYVPTPDIIELLNFGTVKNDAYTDSIEPNKDYYYTARFIDTHDKISNPTEVYKVHMVDDIGSMPYLTITTIDLRESQKEEYVAAFPSSVTVKKYLSIQPNFLQTDITAPGGVDVEVEGKNYKNYDVKIGNSLNVQGGANPGVFGKKFKFRVTSKQTGKKIDINLTVKEPQEIIINE